MPEPSTAQQQTPASGAPIAPAQPGHNSGLPPADVIREMAIAEAKDVEARARLLLQAVQPFLKDPQQAIASMSRETTEALTTMAKQLKIAGDDADTARKKVKEPFDQGGKVVQSVFGAITDPVEATRLQVLAIIAGAMEKLGLPELTSPVGVKAYWRDVVKVEVVDPKAVPAEYLIPDTKAIEAAAKKLPRGQTIPGVKVTRGRALTVA